MFPLPWEIATERQDAVSASFPCTAHVNKSFTFTKETHTIADNAIRKYDINSVNIEG